MSRLLALVLPLALALQAPSPHRAPRTARGAFSITQASDSLKLDDASRTAADAAAKASADFTAASSKLGAQTSDAVAASSKATFEAAQSALKVVDGDAVKKSLQAADGAADATAQALKKSAEALSSVKVDTSAFDAAARRAAEAADAAAQAGAKGGAALQKLDTAQVGKGFADASTRLSSSVNAKTLIPSLNDGMAQLGKNLRVDVDTEAVGDAVALNAFKALDVVVDGGLVLQKKLGEVDASGFDKAVKKASATVDKKLSSLDLDAVAKQAQAQATSAAKMVDTDALKKLSRTVDEKLSGAPSFDALAPLRNLKESLGGAPAAKTYGFKTGAAGAKATGLAAAAQRAADSASAAAKDAASSQPSFEFEAPDFSDAIQAYHAAFPTVADEALDLAALVLVPLVLIAGGTARDGGKAPTSDATQAAAEAERLRLADANKSDAASEAERKRAAEAKARDEQRAAEQRDRDRTADAAKREAERRDAARASEQRDPKRDAESRARDEQRAADTKARDEQKRADERLREDKRLADQKERDEQTAAEEKRRSEQERRWRDDNAAASKREADRAAAARREADERARRATRPAAAPGPYDAAQFMKFCIKHDKFYATQEDYDAHFARWKERAKYVEEYNRGEAAGGTRLVLNAQADLSDEEVAALAEA